MKYKIGDKVKVVKIVENNPNLANLSYAGKVGAIVKIDKDDWKLPYKIYFDDEKESDWFMEKELELVPFTKSDLKDNHIVVLKNGKKSVWGNVKQDKFNEDLSHKEIDMYSIKEVYEFDKLIWKREEQILDEVEKKYLGDVIRPYDVKYIEKSESVSENLEYIKIKVNGEFRGGELIMLPYFKKGTMYKGMELDKEYSLKELGLE